MIETLLVGNPNTGKSTLYNSLTGEKAHVGNWHGVTVEEAITRYKFRGYDISIVDLPGIYSLNPFSLEEKVACEYIFKNKDKIVLNVCDKDNLEHNLYLTLCLMEFGIKVILVLNSINKKKIHNVDCRHLSDLLNVPVVEIDAQNKKDIEKLNQIIIECQSDNYYKKELKYIKNIDFFVLNAFLNTNIPNYEKIKILEDDTFFKNKYHIKHNFDMIKSIAKERYLYIDKLLACCKKNDVKQVKKEFLDKIFLNRIFALPIFLLFLMFGFYLTFFSLGPCLSNVLVKFLNQYLLNPLLNVFIKKFGLEFWFTSFFKEAIVDGLGTILSFLPQVILLFLFLSIMEESGYMARVAFIFDDLLAKFGLSGKSVYTILMGFGCSSSAILTARNMEEENAKIKTSILTPLMSCSAKFPIYAVLGSAFFGVKNIFVIIGLYFLSVFVVLILSYLLNKTILKSQEQSFILEFSSYKFPSIKKIFSVLCENVKLFLIRISSLILLMNIVIWFLSNFSFKFQFVRESGSASILENISKILAPLFIPLGFGKWGIVASLLAGVVAKEIVLSSIGMLNGIDGLSIASLQASLFIAQNPVSFSSRSSMLSFLIFFLFYVPCISSIAILIKEVGKKWTFVGIIIQFIVAYSLSMIVYFFASLIENQNIAFIIMALFLIFIVFSISFFMSRKNRWCWLCPFAKKCESKNKKK